MHFKRKSPVDFLMTAILLLLMSYQVTGEKYQSIDCCSISRTEGNIQTEERKQTKVD